jgi:hypothetical protein
LLIQSCGNWVFHTRFFVLLCCKISEVTVFSFYNYHKSNLKKLTTPWNLTESSEFKIVEKDNIWKTVVLYEIYRVNWKRANNFVHCLCICILLKQKTDVRLQKAWNAQNFACQFYVIYSLWRYMKTFDVVKKKRIFSTILNSLDSVISKMHIHKQWTKLFARFQFTLYISYKTTVFQNIILKSIHVRF